MTSAGATADAPAAARSAARIHSLDGVRGIAALVVVIHHALHLDPTFARVQAAVSAAGESPTVWALTHTPLHIVWAGEEAVLVFFVLSGYVLALPSTRGPVSWRTYYPRRLVRLYLPVWAAIMLAVALKAPFGSASAPERGAWLRERAAVPLSEAWHDSLVVDGAGLLNSPLWSLQWEVIFSLALPAYLLLRRRRSRWVVVEAVALLGLVGVGTVTGWFALRYLPIFGLGVLLAQHPHALDGASSWLDARRRPRLAWGLVVTAVVTLLTARWIVRGLPEPSRLLEAAASAATIVGAVAVLLVALRWAPGTAALEAPAVQWLGARSFSLYLVHEPVIVATALALPRSWGTAPVAVLGVVAAFAVTVAFYRLVERPSIDLARRAGRVGRGLRAPSRRSSSGRQPGATTPGPPRAEPARPRPAPRSR